MYNNAIHVRAIDIQDYDQLLDAWQTEPGIGLNEYDTRGGIEAYLQRNPGLSVLVEDRSTATIRIVGSLLCGHDGRRAYAHHMWVAPDFRRKGLAEALFQEAAARLSAIGIHKTHLFVKSGNNAALNFWAAIGCEQREDLKLFSYGSEEMQRCS